MANKPVIYHNPRCSKSRATLQILQQRDLEPEVIEYLQGAVDKQQLKHLLSLLNLSPRELMRTGQSEYRENNLSDESLSDEQLIDAMLAHPVLIERPIVVYNGKAVIGRPPENVLDIL